MSVILKQRTCRTAEGLAVPEGDPDSAFLVGPKGGKISDETAISLGLIDGWLPENAPKEAKQAAKEADKQHKGPKADKSGRRKAATGSPLPEKKTKGEQLVAIIGGMINEVTAAGNQGGQAAADQVIEKLFTVDKLPDSRVLAARIEQNVSAAERDEAWLEYQIANPDMHFGDEDEKEPGEGGEENKDAGDGGADDII